MHGTSGVSYRGVYYAAALNRAGIATLEVDQWGGRGLPGGASSRPKHLGDVLPDIAGAYHLLAARSDIQATRIGLLGSSMGGIETMLMMIRRCGDALLGTNVHIKAAVAPYPVCRLYNHVPDATFADLVDAAHLSVHVFSGATHEFDVFDGAREFNDPGANQRKGGIIHIRPDPQARQKARDDLVAFFAAAFASK
jgi:dienelactone hydrolase